jgi:hypothetical protein
MHNESVREQTFRMAGFVVIFPKKPIIMPNFEVTLIKSDNTGTPIKVTVSANSTPEAQKKAESMHSGYRANRVDKK